MAATSKLQLLTRNALLTLQGSMLPCGRAVYLPRPSDRAPQGRPTLYSPASGCASTIYVSIRICMELLLRVFLLLCSVLTE